MKNTEFRYKTRNESGKPGREYWGSREWRRYEAREQARAERQAQKHQERLDKEFKEARGDAVQILAFLALLGISIICAVALLGWKKGLLLIAVLVAYDFFFGDD